MNLYLIRHADALPLGDDIETDEERPLSDKGIKQSRVVGKALAGHGLKFDQLVVSPLVRARQTADLILESFSPKPEPVTCEDLVPDGKPRKVAKFLRKLKGEHIALVGHMPQLGDMAGWLVGSRSVSIDFAKAGVACIECDSPGKGSGTLVWLVTPEWMVASIT